MEIDLSLLHSQTVTEVDITDTYIIPKEYYKNSDVMEIRKVQVSGKITVEYEEEEEQTKDHILCEASGTLILKDSISLEPVEYPFSFEYDDILEENCKKNENTLDIFQFLWENILLEVPLQFTKVDDLSKFHGDGWKLIREDDLTNDNNPFNELLKDFKEE